MKKFTVAIVLLIGLYLGSLFFLSNTFFFNSKYGQSLRSVDPTIQWQFFHEQLLTPEQAATNYGSGTDIRLPHRLKEHYDTAKTYGTYIAKLTLPDELINKKIAFFIPFQYGSYKLYVENQLVAQNGVVATDKESQVPNMTPTIARLEVHQKEIFVVMQLSNFYSGRGGFAKPIQVGDATTMIKRFNTGIIVCFFINGIIFIIGLFALLLGIFNKKDLPALLFALICLVVSIRSIFAQPFIHSITIFNIPWEVAVKMEAICTIVATAMAIKLIGYWFTTKSVHRMLSVTLVVLGVQLLITLFTEPLVYQKTFAFVFCMPIVATVFVLIQAVVYLRKFNQEDAFRFLSIISILIAVLHDFIVVNNSLDAPMHVQYTVAVNVLGYVVNMSWQYAQKLRESVKLNQEIMELNATLDQKIKARTMELELANNKLAILASQDALTGIANRHVFDAQLQLHFIAAKKSNDSLALLMIDLDAFKQYNDHYGHVLGDELLCKVVSTIKTQLPQQAIFARYGGEEFALIIPSINHRELDRLGQKIVLAIAEQKFEHAAQMMGIVTVSAGGYCMTATDDFDKATQLIQAADEKLYKAKQAGRNTFVMS